MTQCVAIKSTGFYVPENEITNDQLRKHFGPSQDEFFRELNAVVRMKTTVNVAADLMSQKACQ